MERAPSMRGALDLPDALNSLLSKPKHALALPMMAALAKHGEDSGRIAAAYLRATLRAARATQGWVPLPRSHCCLGYVRNQGQCHGRKGECVELPGSDHSSLWKMPDGEVVYMTEPYGWDMKTMSESIAVCTELGLTLHIDGQSAHFPGWTACVLVSRDTQSRTLRHGAPRLAALTPTEGTGNAPPPARAEAVPGL